MKSYLAVTVDSKLYKKIEALRGREKRSTFVEYLLWLGLEEHTKRPRENQSEQMKRRYNCSGNRLVS